MSNVSIKKESKCKGLVVKPTLSNIFNSRGQVDLTDTHIEHNKDFKFTPNCQDHLTKFVFLKPLKSKIVDKVSYNLVHIFCILGVPFIH